MKKLLLLAASFACISSLSSCGNSAGSGDATEQNDSTQADSTEAAAGETPEAKADVDPFPWDFPKDIALEGAVDGSYALTPISLYNQAIEDGKDLTRANLIFYKDNRTLFNQEGGVTKINDQTVPNALVIPVPAGAKAKKGDIVLTWWQSGSGMQRAVVTDASDPTQPKVVYLDLDWKEDGNGLGNKKKDEQLAVNSFVVLANGTWQPGVEVCCGADKVHGTLINSTADKVIISAFADIIKAFPKSECRLVPFNENYKVGDHVSIDFCGKFKDGYVITKVDAATCHVTVEKANSSTSQPKCVSFYEVAKNI